MIKKYNIEYLSSNILSAPTRNKFKPYVYVMMYYIAE